MKRRRFLGLGLGAAVTPALARALPVSAAQAQPASRVTQHQKLPSDRWTWLELYWVDRDHIPESVSAYLERNYPVFKGTSGWQGVIVNLCWVVDYIALWQGNLDQRIPLSDMLVGAEWERFSPQLQRRPAAFDKATYPPWTYRDLKRLAEEFRRQAAERYGMNDFRFLTTLLGYDDWYLTSRPSWRTEHAEVYFHDDRFPYNKGRLNPGAHLQPDHRQYAAFPDGIPGGTPFYHFFAAQWGSLSKAVGINGLMFEDDMFGPPEYSNYGAWGVRGSWDPAEMERWHQAAASLVRETKLANPDSLVIGYSSAVGGVAEWRVGGVDLERIAQEGYLDAWIDQTWGGGWTEYWELHRCGYTFQLAFLLTHAAQLAKTRTRHYFVIGATDPYEPWDSLHVVPLKQQWEIWAYSHAALKMPTGLKVPDGIVFFSPTRGRDLWSQEDVAFLVKNADAATADALKMRDVRGPTLVYNRPYLDWLQHEHPDWLVKEFIDDHAGMLMKWQVPIISITRIEWLPQVRSDLFVLQTPARLDAQTAGAILRLYHSGEPLAIVGDPTFGIDPGLKEILSPPCETLPQIPGAKGIWTSAEVPDRSLKSAWIITKVPLITDGLSPTFELWQGFYSQTGTTHGKAIYKTGTCPDLLFTDGGSRHWLFWNPPYFSPREYKGNENEMDVLIASPEPYVLAARSFLKLLSDTGRSPFDPSNPVSLPLAVHYWEGAGGELEFLAGNLERALPGDSETPKTLNLTLPKDWVQSAASQLNVTDLTGDQVLTARRGAEGGWEVRLSVDRNGSNVWVFHRK